MPAPTLILGPLPGLEDALGDAISAAQEPDPLAPVTVLVGQSLLKRYLPRALAMRGVPHINVRYVLPDELTESLAGEAAGKLVRMSRAAERLIARVSAELDGPYFTAPTRSDGFIDAVVRLSRELERGGFDPGRLHELLTRAEIPTRKTDHLAAILGEQHRLRERAGLAGLAQFQAEAEPAAFEGTLIIYGVWAPTATTLALLDALIVRHAVTVLLPTYGEAQEHHATFQAWLTDRGASLSHLPTDPNAPASRIFGPVDGRRASGVTLVSTPDTVREVWEAARACLAWARDGIAFHEMAVVYRHREQHRALAEEIFSEAGIPTYMHDGSPLAEHPVGRRLLLLLELLTDTSFSRQTVMEFVTETQFPPATHEAYSGLRSAEWDGYSREAGVVAGIEQWQVRLRRLANSQRERSKAENFGWLAGHAERVETMRQFVEDLHAAVTARPGAAPWDRHLAFLRSVAQTYADGLDPILSALDELKALAIVQPIVTFEVFAEAVREDLRTRDASHVLGAPLRQFGRHGVAVMDASSLRHMRFRSVYLIGLSERSWPPPARPDPLLLEHEREALNRAAADQRASLPLRSTPDEEPLTFRLCVEAANEHLIASYARTEAGHGGRHVPSHFFRALAEAVAGRAVSSQELETGPLVHRVRAGRLTVDPIEASVTISEYQRCLVEDGIESGLEPVIAALSLDRALRTRRGRWGRSLTEYDGALSGAEARALAASIEVGRSTPVSASRLETYATCPYRYFLRYVLRIEPLNEPETLDGIDHLERGSLIHAILEQFLRALGPEDPPRAEARERHLKLLSNVAEAEAQKREERGVTGRPLVWAVEKRRIFEDLDQWYDREVSEGEYTSLRPRGFEVGFGAPGYGFIDDDTNQDPLSSETPVRFDASGREFLLQGRIDRIDVSEDGKRFRVIDYKTGRKADKSVPDAGRALQLPLYLHAASQALGVSVENGEAQYYFCTRRGEYFRSRLAGEEFVRRRDKVDQAIRTIADGVDGGYFAPNPGHGAANCRFCDFKLVCNTGIDRIMNLKDEDERAAAFIAMQDLT